MGTVRGCSTGRGSIAGLMGWTAGGTGLGVAVFGGACGAGSGVGLVTVPGASSWDGLGAGVTAGAGRETGAASVGLEGGMVTGRARGCGAGWSAGLVGASAVGRVGASVPGLVGASAVGRMGATAVGRVWDFCCGPRGGGRGTRLRSEAGVDGSGNAGPDRGDDGWGAGSRHRRTDACGGWGRRSGSFQRRGGGWCSGALETLPGLDDGTGRDGGRSLGGRSLDLGDHLHWSCNRPLDDRGLSELARDVGVELDGLGGRDGASGGEVPLGDGDGSGVAIHVGDVGGVVDRCGLVDVGVVDLGDIGGVDVGDVDAVHVSRAGVIPGDVGLTRTEREPGGDASSASSAAEAE